MYLNVNGVDGWSDMKWKLSSKSVNVVFTKLGDTAVGGNVGAFHIGVSATKGE